MNAVIERGSVLAVSAAGYTVASFDREGIQSPPIQAIDESVYTVGSRVYFFLFPDGTGKILCGM
jgi:hypothetical protein